MVGQSPHGTGRLAAPVASVAGRTPDVESVLLVVLVALYPFHTIVGVAGVPFNLSFGDPVVVLVGVLWAVGLVGSRRLPRYLLPVAAFGLVASASLAVNALVGGAYFSGSAAVARFAKLFGGVAWLVAVYVLAREDPAGRLPVAALASAAVAVALAWWIVYYGFVAGVTRVMWPFANPNILGNYLLLNVCLALYAWRSVLARRLEGSAVIVVPALAVLLLGILATGSRGAAIGVAVVAVAAIVLSESVDWRQAIGGAVAAGAFGLVAVLLALQRNPFLLSRALSSRNIDSRIELWSVAGRAAGSNPLLGIGYGQFPWYLPTRIPGWQTGVHNTYLLLAAEVGLLGLVAFLGIFAVAVRDGIELRNRYPAVLFLLAFVLGTFGQAVGTDVDNFRSLWLAVGFVGAYADRYGAARLPLARHLPLVEAAPAGSTGAGTEVTADGVDAEHADREGGDSTADEDDRVSTNGAGPSGDAPGRSSAAAGESPGVPGERGDPGSGGGRGGEGDPSGRRDSRGPSGSPEPDDGGRPSRSGGWSGSGPWSASGRWSASQGSSGSGDRGRESETAGPVARRYPHGREHAVPGETARRDEDRAAVTTDGETTPAVSVVITTYNEAEYIESALDSLLAQTLEDVEIVVVDDGSEDDTVERVRAYDAESIRLLERAHVGRSAALNCGIRHADADYVAIVDPDDPSRPDRLEVQYRFLESRPEVGAVGSAYEAVDRIRGERYVRHYPTEHEEIVAAMAKYIPIAHSSMMARTDAIEAAGYYDESADAIVDLDLLLRIGQHYRLANLEEPLIRREIRPDSSFHSMYTPLKRRLRLLSLNMAAVDAFALPWYYRAYPPLHLLYSVLPARLKRPIRRRFSAIREY